MYSNATAWIPVQLLGYYTAYCMKGYTGFLIFVAILRMSHDKFQEQEYDLKTDTLEWLIADNYWY